MPRTIYHDPGDDAYHDQIAWFTESDSDVPALNMNYRTGGMFDLTEYCLQGEPTHNIWPRLSDHFPLWTEFGTRGS